MSYVAADESDIIKLRTNVWKERVYLYRLLATKEQAKALLEAYLDEMNRLVDEPKYMHAGKKYGNSIKEGVSKVGETIK